MFGRVKSCIDDEQQDVAGHSDSICRFTRFIEHTLGFCGRPPRPG